MEQECNSSSIQDLFYRTFHQRVYKQTIQRIFKELKQDKASANVRPHIECQIAQDLNRSSISDSLQSDPEENSDSHEDHTLSIIESAISSSENSISEQVSNKPDTNRQENHTDLNQTLSNHSLHSFGTEMDPNHSHSQVSTYSKEGNTSLESDSIDDGDQLYSFHDIYQTIDYSKAEHNHDSQNIKQVFQTINESVMDYIHLHNSGVIPIQLTELVHVANINGTKLFPTLTINYERDWLNQFLNLYSEQLIEAHINLDRSNLYYSQQNVLPSSSYVYNSSPSLYTYYSPYSTMNMESIMPSKTMTMGRESNSEEGDGSSDEESIPTHPKNSPLSNEFHNNPLKQDLLYHHMYYNTMIYEAFTNKKIKDKLFEKTDIYCLDYLTIPLKYWISAERGITTPFDTHSSSSNDIGILLGYDLFGSSLFGPYYFWKQVLPTFEGHTRYTSGFIYQQSTSKLTRENISMIMSNTSSNLKRKDRSILFVVNYQSFYTLVENMHFPNISFLFIPSSISLNTFPLYHTFLSELKNTLQKHLLSFMNCKYMYNFLCTHQRHHHKLHIPRSKINRFLNIYEKLTSSAINSSSFQQHLIVTAGLNPVTMCSIDRYFIETRIFNSSSIHNKSEKETQETSSSLQPLKRTFNSSTNPSKQLCSDTTSALSMSTNEISPFSSFSSKHHAHNDVTQEHTINTTHIVMNEDPQSQPRSSLCVPPSQPLENSPSLSTTLNDPLLNTTVRKSPPFCLLNSCIFLTFSTHSPY